MRGRSLYSQRARSAPSPLRLSRGIATIELGAVVAVTLVLVAVAASAYRTYSVRREVRTTLAAMMPVQELVTDAVARTGVPPASESDMPATALPHQYIESVTIEHGRIAIRFGDDADESLRGRSLSVSPFETMDGEIFWLCGSHRAGVGLYPLGLFGGTRLPERVLTTVDDRFLPPECR